MSSSLSQSRSRGVAAVVALALGATGCASAPPASRPAPTDPPVPAAARPGAPPGLRIAWRWQAPPPASVGMPAADSAGVAATAGHHLVVLVGAGGHERWRAEVPGVREVAPLLTPSSVVVADEGGLVALARRDGRIRWRTTLGGRASTPVLVDGVIVTCLWGGAIAAVDEANGSPRWRVALGGLAISPPAAGAGIVLAGWESPEAAGIVALAAGSGAPRWEAGLPRGSGAPAVIGRAAITVAGDGTVRSLGLHGGGLDWSVPIGGPGGPEVPAAAASGGDVLVSTAGGRVARLGGRSGELRWVTTGGVPALRGGPVGGRAGAQRVAVPLDGDVVLLLDPRREPGVVDPPGAVSGIAVGPAGTLVVATSLGRRNELLAYDGW